MEQNIDERLQKAAAEYAMSKHKDKALQQIVSWDFIAGAQWQFEQMEKERLKHCDELTPKQAQTESDFVTSHLERNNRTPTFIDAIEYGRKDTIEKACEWWENELYYPSMTPEELKWYKAKVNAFRRAMEE